MSKSWPDFILEQLIRRIVYGYRRFRFRICCRAAALYHEIRYHSMERTAIVEARSAEGEEVLGCFGHCFAKDLELDVAA